MESEVLRDVLKKSKIETLCLELLQDSNCRDLNHAVTLLESFVLNHVIPPWEGHCVVMSLKEAREKHEEAEKIRLFHLKLHTQIFDETKVPQGFRAEVKKHFDALLIKYNNITARFSPEYEEQMTDLLDAFGSAADRSMSCAGQSPAWQPEFVNVGLFGKEVGGIVAVCSELTEARNLAVEWIKKGIFTLENVPRKVARLSGKVTCDSLDIEVQCGLLEGDDLTLESEARLHFFMYHYDSSIDDDDEALRRLLWLTPFDMVTERRSHRHARRKRRRCSEGSEDD